MSDSDSEKLPGSADLLARDACTNRGDRIDYWSTAMEYLPRDMLGDRIQTHIGSLCGIRVHDIGDLSRAEFIDDQIDFRFRQSSDIRGKKRCYDIKHLSQPL
ncbi:hypothetical protein BS630_25440 [Rhizobium laguerreae]|nr:hypothetical protein BS630_25440 [Rhizobium laguerreae]